MKILVYVAMIALVVVLGLDVLITLYEFLFEDRQVLLDFMELTAGAYEAPFWFTGCLFLTGAFSWVAVVFVFWPLQKIISLRAISFTEVGRNLTNSAYAGIAFWVGCTLMFTIFPLIYIAVWGVDPDSETSFIPLGIETVFLVMSLTFLAIGKTLERANEIETENNQFL